MDKTLQTKAWNCLPKEFKEEVKAMYNRPFLNDLDFGYKSALLNLFGHHNLTSDAEGEEMLTVSRKKVQRRYHMAYKCKHSGLLSHDDVQFWKGWQGALDDLFGSKCLPDERNEDSFTTKEPKFKYKEGDKVVRYCDGKVYVVVDYCEDDNINHYIMVDALGNRYSDSEGNLELYEGPKYCVGQEVRHKGQNHEIGEIVKYGCDEDPGRYSVRFGKEYHNISEAMLEPYEEPKSAEPKFKVGDIVRFKYCCTTYRIDGFKMSDGVMLYQVGEVWAEESDLEPYTEPKENANLSQEAANCDKLFDNILKDSFAKERRLNIAAMAMQGILSNPTATNGPKLTDGDEKTLAEWSLRFADALIAECNSPIN